MIGPNPMYQSILKHYDNNSNQVLEGLELKAFVGDIIRACPGLKFDLVNIDEATRLVEVGFVYCVC